MSPDTTLSLGDYSATWWSAGYIGPFLLQKAQQVIMKGIIAHSRYGFYKQHYLRVSRTFDPLTEHLTHPQFRSRNSLYTKDIRQWAHVRQVDPRARDGLL